MATFTNQAQVSFNGIVRSSNITVGEIVETLTMTKTAVSDTYTLGSDVTYIINIVNTGGASFIDLTLTDDLGETESGGIKVNPLSYNVGSVRYFLNGTLQSAPQITSEQPLTITGISVPAGGNTTIVYEATITNFAPLGTDGAITNSVNLTDTASGRQTACPQSVDLTATATITPATEPDLTISKSLSPTTVPENGRITYTFVIANYGNTAADAADNVIVTDIFLPVLQGLTAELDGTALALGTDYTYDTATGAFATVAGIISVPAATFSSDPATGAVTTTPGTVTLTVTGNI